MTSESPTGSGSVHRGDAGETVEVVDVVGGRRSDLTGALVSLHREAFPDYSFALDEIALDAELDPVRDGIRVHQSMLLVDETPAGFILFDTNVVRRFCVVHFAAVTRSAQTVRVGGRRLSAVAVARALATSTADLAGDLDGDLAGGLRGLIGEAPGPAVRLWEWVGLRRLQVDYAEPVHGRGWFEHLEAGRDDPRAPVSHTPVSPIALMWLPPDPTTETPLDPDAVRDAAAAYLLDHYWLDPTHPLVISLIGADVADAPSRPLGRQPSRLRRLSRYDS